MHPLQQLQLLETQLAAKGLNVDVQADDSVPMRGYWVIKIGQSIFHQVNTPAAIAMLDGALAGAQEAERVMSYRIAGA